MQPWAERLNDALRDSGLSMADLARKSGVKYDSIVKYISGNVTNPSRDSIERISDALGVSSLYLKEGVVLAQDKSCDYYMIRDQGIVSFEGCRRLQGGQLAGVELLSRPLVARVCTRQFGREFRLSDLLVCEKLSGSSLTFAVGKDCIVETASRELRFGLLSTSETDPGTYDLSIAGQDMPQRSLVLSWAAPVMFISRID